MLTAKINTFSVSTFALLYGITLASAFAQQRGQWLSGLESVNSGVQPDPGFTYANIFYSSNSDRLKGPNGQGIPVDGQFAIFADNNIFFYVYKQKILGGNLESIADIIITNANLAGDVFTPRIPGVPAVPVNGGGGGLGNSYFVPLQMGWHLKRLDVQAGYAFVAPTGRYSFGASNNNGVGYWTNAIQAGATIYLTSNKATAINAFNFYAWNTQQQNTHITYGQSDSFDYSVTQILPLTKDNKYLLQTGPVGYGQWQTSSPSFPSAASSLPPGVVLPVVNSRYGVNAIGFTANVLVPGRKFSVGGSAFGNWVRTTHARVTWS